MNAGVPANPQPYMMDNKANQAIEEAMGEYPALNYE
jgi:hypothetical protein